MNMNSILGSNTNRSHQQLPTSINHCQYLAKPNDERLIKNHLVLDVVLFQMLISRIQNSVVNGQRTMIT